MAGDTRARLHSKYVPRADMLAVLEGMPRPWVMTNGVFDLLHRGHVEYLDQARQLGSTLIVAVNSDISVKTLGKGPLRPINPDMDRALVLAALESVSIVTLFDESTPVSLLVSIRPDIYVKGGDYNMADLQETKLVQAWGGESLAIEYKAGYSTTALINKIHPGHPSSAQSPKN